MVSKGSLIVVGHPYMKQCRTILVVAILVAAFLAMLAYVNGSWIALILAVLCMLGFGALLLKPEVVVREVRVYENGLERQMPRDAQDRRIFVPWAAVEEYRWDSDVLRFQCGGSEYYLFVGEEPASSRLLQGVKTGILYNFIHLGSYHGFPAEVQVPLEYVPDVRSLLSRATRQ